jgi:hypothetical protein
MMNKIGHLRALALLSLLAAGCGDDKQETETGTGSGTDSDSTTGGTTPTTGDETGGEAQCSPSAQDCPAGSKCTSYGKLAGDAWNANKCVPEPMKGGVAGDPCSIEGADMFTGIDNCAKGYICQNVDADQKNGICTEYCTPEMTCPNTSGGDGICLFDSNEGTLPICLPLCDPLLQDCGGESACYGDPSGPPFFCYNPDPKDGGMDGSSCDFTNACLAGLTCAQADTQEGCVTTEFGCCSPFCALDEMTCTGGEECVPFFMEVQVGFENVGVCALPG